MIYGGKNMKNLKSFKNKYQFTTIEDDGCYMSEEAKKFAREFKSALSNELKKDTNCEITKFQIGHYDLFAFVYNRDTQKYCYIDYSIPRWGEYVDLDNRGCLKGFLVRTAKNDNDYTGGSNHFANITELKNLIVKLVA